MKRTSTHRTSTSPPLQTTKLPSSFLQDMKKVYRLFRSIATHAFVSTFAFEVVVVVVVEVVVEMFPTIANDIIDAYVGSR